MAVDIAMQRARLQPKNISNRDPEKEMSTAGYAGGRDGWRQGGL